MARAYAAMMNWGLIPVMASALPAVMLRIKPVARRMASRIREAISMRPWEEASMEMLRAVVLDICGALSRKRDGMPSRWAFGLADVKARKA